MSNGVATLSKKTAANRPTLRSLQGELRALRERVEDLEDLRELNAAIARNRGKRLIPWAAARRDLELDD
jgi:hypothetical protein